MKDIQLSDVDRRIVSALACDGRMPYKELAELVGLPVSTCHGRVRALESRGIITGYHAEVDPVAAGSEVQALILIRIHSHHRNRVSVVSDELVRLPGVQRVFLIGGDIDLVVHVATASVAALRSFVSEHFGSDPIYAHTQTQLVFEARGGQSPL
ncbi:Lrp/AsnC family transcriptional regulator [Leucobacter insecticola]|uniref:Lrp/AsnC family transcriptional regulator n=1 Tax=Leucobacter insecticola TaxID=2714934 RepID=A0A6G8FGC1_9MICO|nr:Lrp/AsnC family transcriptional regulator [Leucobacter insecticola]QIM15404.1 Lrp/AsnC family transcriptional regulator [Leucobacter insecticola]